MIKFVNEYKNTSEMTSEIIKAWWIRRFKVNLICTALLAIFILCFAFITKDWKYITLELVPLFVIIVYFVRRNGDIKTQQERLKVLFKNEIPSVRVELDETSIYTHSSQTERTIDYTDLDSVKITKNLIILIIKGNMNLALSKTGFTKGTCDECIAFLNEKSK